MVVVEVDDAIAGNMILVDGQFQFRRQPTASPCQIRHRESPNPISDWVPGEDQYGSVAARGSGKPQFIPSQRPSRSILRPDPIGDVGIGCHAVVRS
jgi:hypothetical protein